MMAYRLGCELSEVVSGIAPVSGALDTTCTPAHPISVMIFHGTQDQNVLYDGGQGPAQVDRKHSRTDNSVDYAVQFWRKQNRCSANPQYNQHGNIIQDNYSDCREGTSVVLYTIQDGGHGWPGGQAYLSGVQPTSEISASMEIIDFLLAHPKMN